MGTGATRELRSARQTSRTIDESLEEEKMTLPSKIKLLLLGASESGKSTVVKQMKILHKNGFSKDERLTYKSVIMDNLLEYSLLVIEAMATMQIKFKDPQCQGLSQSILPELRKREGRLNTLKIHGLTLRKIFEDEGCKECVRRGHEFQLNDSAKYLFQSLNRISDDNYIPTDKDILLSRAQTCGITETSFSYKGYLMNVVDVGGQRTERRKWIHCFDNVTGVLFVVALSFYDEVVDDNTRKNKLIESLELFEALSSNQYFYKSDFIVFFNKKDIFEKKIKKVSIKVCFPNFKGESTLQDSSSYIQKEFKKRTANDKSIYPHFTNATDTSNIDRVFDTSMDIILKKNLFEAGFV